MISNLSYSPETPNLGQIRRFLEPCDLAIWLMTLKTIGHLFFSTSSFVHHFITIGVLKLELQSGNAKFGSNLAIFRAVWPWNLTDDLEQGKSEGFDSCDRPSNLTQIGFKSSIFQPVHRFSQKWQLSVCKWNFRVCKMSLLMKIPMKMKELW